MADLYTDPVGYGKEDPWLLNVDIPAVETATKAKDDPSPRWRGKLTFDEAPLFFEGKRPPCDHRRPNGD